jgi:predicted phage-related endonuclease
MKLNVETHEITDRESWLALRRQDVTATDIGTLAGANPYAGPFAVYADKAGHKPAMDSDAMKRGRWHEAAIVEMLQEERPDWKTSRAKVYLRAPELRLGSTPDGFVIKPNGKRGILECKSVTRNVFDSQWTEDQPPLRYVLQALTNAMLADADFAVVAALVRMSDNADRPVIIELERHAGAEARIRELAADFWTKFEANDWPEPSYNLDLDIIEARWRNVKLDKIDLTTHNRAGELAQQYLEWAERRRNCEGALDVLKAELIDALKGADVAIHPDFNISWKEQSRKEVTVAASSFRVLRVTKKKAKATASETEEA